MASNPSAHSTSAFTAHWEPVKGTDTYLLDVSASANFSDFVEGYEARPITGSSTQVSGLTAGTTYHYRVRAANTSGTSDPSEVITTLTIAEQTSILGFADHTSTKFRVSWEEVSGVGSYQVLVATDPNFNDTVAGNDPLKVQNFLTEAFIEGLTPNTIYYVKVRSINGSGNSDYSVIKTTATANSDGSVVKPSINNLDFDDQAMSLTWSVSGGTGGITSILVSHRKITESEFTTTQISVEQSGDYQISVDTDWMDAIGMQYQVEAQDLAGRNDLTDLVTYNKTVEDIEVSITETFGTTVNDYQIISIPYELSTTRIEDLFEGVLGNYDKAKWRLLKYKNDESGYVDYEDGLAVSNVERGAGYWFISSQSVNLMFGDGLTPSNTIDEPFELELNQGWNQIGNPYLEDINWSDILKANDNPEAVGSLLVYNSAEASFQEGDVLHVFGGGFVFADQATSLTIPVDINVSASGGRVRSAAQSASVKDWQLDFRLTQGQKVNPLSGIGMSAMAQQGKDQADVLNPPHFGDQVSLYTQHDDFFYASFTKDIIDLQPQYHWEFNLQSGSDEAVVLSWDPSQLPDGTLILYDLHANRIVDMASSSDYTFTKANQTFNIYYSAQLIELENNALQLGRAFPNPVMDNMEIPYGFHIGAERSKVEIRIFDRQGIEVLQHSTTSQAQGIRSLVWDRKDTQGQQLPAGLYFYQVSSITGSHSQRSTGKIIIK
ncbi:MAG: fibronectin type III domain-containing protein [Reichenbachiella sp.]|uniref:fibronectin type III domain-containing protein n=1 Tax=Reichenbachiella sp. TaxID=2184521 RepID=UPI0032669D7F